MHQLLRMYLDLAWLMGECTATRLAAGIWILRLVFGNKTRLE
jgi:hypothetical protein